MKIIKLFLLLSLGIWAEFKLDIPNEIHTEQLECIVENGWNDKNETLNQFIINYEKRGLSCTLQKISKPIQEVEPTKENPVPVPEFILNKADYLLLFSYMRYLESKGHIDQSLETHINVLHGLNNIQDKSMIGVIYRIVIEKITTDSLRRSIINKLSSIRKKELKKEFEQYLLLDFELFWSALDEDRNVTKKLLNYNIDFEIPDKKEYLQAVYKEVNILIKETYDKYHHIDSKKSLEAFNEKFKKDKEVYLREKEKLKKTNQFGEKSLSAKILALEVYYKILGNFSYLKLDLQEQIKSNRILINSL